MKEAHLEHVNITVSNPDATAAILCQIFGWTIRWSGDAMDNGYTVHVGSENSYIAIYSNDQTQTAIANDYKTIKNLNHLGIVVDNLSDTEAKVLAAGCKPHSHRQYSPGASFYFHTLDDLEIEVVSYS